MASTQGWASSHSLDLFDRWQVMETRGGKWRFTSPTHVVHAFSKAMDELDAEGGVDARFIRYVENQKIMVTGMRDLGRLEGIGAAPEGGATLAALRQLRDDGTVSASDRVVLLNTGGALKYLDVLVSDHA